MTQPDVLPRATEHIPEMVALLERLLAAGHAYRTDDGSIFFRIASWPAYGRLARLDPDQLRVGERVAADEYSKDDVRDFVLWKGRRDGEPSWETAVGPGRPGWHLECSAMSMRYLGESFDIHTGGVDLVFPHHEDEIAQSEAATGKPFVRTWLHCAHLQMGGRKMAKSEGNIARVADLLAAGTSPRALRYALLAAHYRTGLNFSDDSLSAATAAVERLDAVVAALEAYAATGPDDPALAGVLAARARHSGPPSTTTSRSRPPWARCSTSCATSTAASRSGPFPRATPAPALAALRDLDVVLGLLPDPVDALPADLAALLESRAAARAARDWAASDRLRDELAAAGILVEDSRDGQRWRRVGGRPVPDGPGQPHPRDHGNRPAAARSAAARPTAAADLTRASARSPRPAARRPGRRSARRPARGTRQSARCWPARHLPRGSTGPRRHGPPRACARARPTKARAGAASTTARGTTPPTTGGPRTLDDRGPRRGLGGPTAAPRRPMRRSPHPPASLQPAAPGVVRESRRVNGARAIAPGHGPGPRPGPVRGPALSCTRPGLPLPPEATLGDGEEVDRRSPSGRGGVRGRPAGAAAPRHAGAPRCAGAARPPRHDPADPRRGDRGRLAHRGHRVRRAPGGRPRRRGSSRPRRSADVLARAIERGEAAFVLALDSLEDPQNVGTLLRSAEAAGVHGVVFPTRRQAPLSPAAVKASAGATEHLLLAPVDDLPGTLADLHVRGLRMVGTDAEAALTYREADLRGPLVLVIGSEGRGLAPRDPPPLRPPGPDPDARPDRVAQRRRGGLRPRLRGGRAARAPEGRRRGIAGGRPPPDGLPTEGPRTRRLPAPRRSDARRVGRA